MKERRSEIGKTTLNFTGLSIFNESFFYKDDKDDGEEEKENKSRRCWKLQKKIGETERTYLKFGTAAAACIGGGTL